MRAIGREWMVKGKCDDGGAYGDRRLGRVVRFHHRKKTLDK